MVIGLLGNFVLPGKLHEIIKACLVGYVYDVSIYFPRIHKSDTRNEGFGSCTSSHFI
jgi:hypothetical protein